MQDQRIRGPEPPAPATREHDVQRKVLIELVLAPPPYTDDVARLAARIGESPGDVERALGALARVGLARRDGRLAWATPAARYCEALYPMYP
jgi:hypothetical protein